MKRRHVMPFLSLLALAGCAVVAPAGTATLGPEPATAGGTFNSAGGISVALEAVNLNGKTGVCGVWAESDNQSVLTKGRAGLVVDSGVVVFDGAALVHGLRFLRKVEPAPSYAGQTGNCIVTERPWGAQDAGRKSQIVIPRQVVYRDIDDGQGGFDVVFRPGGPSAHPSDPKPWDD